MKLDHKIILDFVDHRARVLDLGCGDGDLLALLEREKQVRAQGIELNEDAIYQCVEKGLSVFHGDIESGLKEYPDGAFDYVILNQSFQEVLNVEFVIDEALRVGRKVLVGFPNFAYIKARMDLFFRGIAPMDEALPYAWYDTPNLHFLSIRDFCYFCRKKAIHVVASRFVRKNTVVRFWPNLLALNAVFLVTKDASGQ